MIVLIELLLFFLYMVNELSFTKVSPALLASQERVRAIKAARAEKQRANDAEQSRGMKDI